MKVNHIKRCLRLMFLFAIPHTLVASEDPSSLALHAFDDLASNRQLTQSLWRDSQQYAVEVNVSKKMSDIMYAYFLNGGGTKAIKEAQSDDKLVETIASVLDQKPFTEELAIITHRSILNVFIDLKISIFSDQNGNRLTRGIFNAPIFRQSFEEKKKDLLEGQVEPQTADIEQQDTAHKETEDDKLYLLKMIRMESD